MTEQDRLDLQDAVPRYLGMAAASLDELEGLRSGPDECGLCKHHNKTCAHCPVYARTQMRGCVDTPYNLADISAECSDLLDRMADRCAKQIWEGAAEGDLHKLRHALVDSDLGDLLHLLQAENRWLLSEVSETPGSALSLLHELFKERCKREAEFLSSLMESHE